MSRQYVYCAHMIMANVCISSMLYEANCEYAHLTDEGGVSITDASIM